MVSDLKAGSVAKLVFNRSFGVGDSPPLLLCGEFGGNDGGERSAFDFAFGETESDSLSTVS